MADTRERDVQARVMLAVGALPYVRVWRQNVGTAVPIGVVQQALRQLDMGNTPGAHGVLRRARVVQFGLKGAADLTGVLACGKRLELECKRDGGKQSKDQQVFQRVMEALGALYAVVHSADEAQRVLDSHVSACDTCSRRTTWSE